MWSFIHGGDEIIYADKRGSRALVKTHVVSWRNYPPRMMICLWSDVKHSTFLFCRFPYFRDVWQKPLNKNIIPENCQMLMYQNILLWLCCTQAVGNIVGAVVKCSKRTNIIYTKRDSIHLTPGLIISTWSWILSISSLNFSNSMKFFIIWSSKLNLSSWPSNNGYLLI